MTTSARVCKILACTALAVACAAPTKVTKTLDDPAYRNASFKYFLVIGVSEDYNSRAQFERQMVSAIRSNGGSATAYYTVVGNNPPINREQLGKAIREGNFDAVLLTRVKGQENTVDVIRGAPDIKATRRSGNAFDLFRYDYEELNDPDRVQVNISIVIVTELYDAAKEIKIWAIESSNSSSNGAGVLIDKEVESIIQQLRKDKLIGT